MIIHRFSDRETIEDFRILYARTLEACQNIWGNAAFKRPNETGWRDQFLAGMYDAQMISVSMLNQAQRNKCAENSDLIINETRKLFENFEFDKSVRQGTNNRSFIKRRIETVYNLLLEISKR